jgi:hypothetical protein
MSEASAERRYERAAALLRRRDRLGWLLERLEGVLRATHSAPRLVVAQHPVKQRFDAFWLVQGRVVDWGPLPGPTELAERTEAALGRLRGGSRRVPVPPEEVDEVRIASTWVAANEPPVLSLEAPPSPEELEEWVGGVADRDALVAVE